MTLCYYGYLPTLISPFDLIRYVYNYKYYRAAFTHFIVIMIVENGCDAIGTRAGSTFRS